MCHLQGVYRILKQSMFVIYTAKYFDTIVSSSGSLQHFKTVSVISTAKCFGTIVSSSGSLQTMPAKFTQLLIIEFIELRCFTQAYI